MEPKFCPICNSLLLSKIYYCCGEPRIEWHCPDCGWHGGELKTIVTNKVIMPESKEDLIK